MASESGIAPEPHGVTERGGRVANGRRSVGAEMEAIFAPLPRSAVAMATDIPKAAARTRARGPGIRPWLAWIAAVALAALIGSFAFLPISMRTPPTRQPVATSPAPARAAPRLASPRAAETGFSPAAVVIPTTAPLKEGTPPARSPVAKARRPNAQPAYHGRCPRRAHAAWCLRGSVMAADRELRGAYAAAERAGVDRRTLLDIRSDWKRLRGRANKDPQALIRGFGELAQELRAQTRRARR